MTGAVVDTVTSSAGKAVDEFDLESKTLQNRIQVIDAFRALAILSVMAFHLLYYVNNSPGEFRVDTPVALSAFARYGYLGVEFFFIISGFVIFMTLRRSGSLVEFFWRRFARIWPAYLASAVIVWVGIRFLDYQPYARSIYDLLVSPFVWTLPFQGAHISGVYWSLVVELKFYFFVGAAYFSLGPKWFPLGWLVLSAVSMGAIWFFPLLAEHLFVSGMWPFFTVGIVFYIIHKKEMSLAYGLLATFTVLEFAIMWSADSVVLAIVGGMIAFFSLFVLGLLDWLCVRPLLFVGKISYSLYLLHFELCIALAWALVRSGVPVWPALAFATGCIFVLAVLFEHFVERPGRAWLNTQFNALALRSQR